MICGWYDSCQHVLCVDVKDALPRKIDKKPIMAVCINATRIGIILVKKMLLFLASSQIAYEQMTHPIYLIKYPPKQRKKPQKISLYFFLYWTVVLYGKNFRV